ncbi:type II toxin-antitoxin system RelE/ParE family toxin (plasmid) [Xenorhabdus stockiae]|uniref:type II toxin-antitoxin system RelE/ParE family toxin n=1 Tax=Xenorhabdus stockiae TaxID=351614 RepID=UPI003CF2DFD5
MVEIFFHQAADYELDNLSIKLQANFYSLIEVLSEKPHLLREPHCKPLDKKTKIFELRTGDGHNVARGTWCYGEEKNTIYILSFFIKKTQKTDSKDIQTAINRKKDMIVLYQRGELA